MPIYMNFPGVPGNSKGKWAGWIEVKSASIGLSNREGRKPDVLVVKIADSSSSALYRQAMMGEAKDVELAFVEGNDAPYLHVALKGAIISWYSSGGSGAEGNQYEQFNFDFESIEYTSNPRSTPKNAQDAQQAAKAGWATGQ